MELLPYVPEVPRTFHQLGILVLDGSGSMSGHKAREVANAVNALLDRMSRSRMKNNFSFACVMFDNSPTTILTPTELTQLDYSKIDFNPYNYKGGGTEIYNALAEAERIAKDFLRGAEEAHLPHSVVILLMSDGMCFRPDATKQRAELIKQDARIKIACAYFSYGESESQASGAIELLKEVASGPAYYATIYDGETLRKFFERSISKSSGTKL